MLKGGMSPGDTFSLEDKLRTKQEEMESVELASLFSWMELVQQAVCGWQNRANLDGALLGWGAEATA